MKFSKIVFVVLVYRNTDDLKDFFKSNKIHDSSTIVVVSHYDDKSDAEFSLIAAENNADVIIVENKGYGYGNNKGIEFALKKYNFEYLIVSNADISIRSFNVSELNKYPDCIIAPKIISLSGKKQNPAEAYQPSHLAHYIMYWLYSGSHTKLIWFMYAFLRLKRIFFNLTHLRNKPCDIFSAHGSFVVFPYSVLTKLQPLYNEKMFLMNEEGHVARKALECNIKTKYLPSIIIDHKEDGSMSLEYINEFPILKQSFIEFYTYWYK